MVAIGNSAEGGVEGVALTVANSGGASGTACETPTSAGALRFAAAAAMHGSFGLEVVPQSGVIREGRWNFTAAQVLQFRGYWRRTADPTATHTILQIKNGATNLFFLSTSASNPGRINLLNAAGSPIFGNASSNTVIDTEYRIEFNLDLGTSTSDGEVEFRLYAGESTTPQATYSSGATINLGGPLDGDNIRLGRPSPTTTDLVTEHWDSWNVWTAGDIPATLSNPYPGEPPDKIDFTALKVSTTEMSVAWVTPADAPNGVDVIYCPGVQSNDGDGDPPSDPLYDPTDLVGSVTAGTQLDDLDSPLSIPGLTPGSYTVWIVRSSP